MKSLKFVSWLVFVNVGALAACGGSSTIGNGTDPNGGSKADGGSVGNPGAGTGTSIGATSGKPGTGSGGSTSMGASTGTGNTGTGNTGNGTGNAPGMGECASDLECGDESCEQCPGTGAPHCTRGMCIGGKCQTYDIVPCVSTCSGDKDCATLDIGCTDCGNGSQACQTSACVMGFCQTKFQGCANVDECAGQACGAVCKNCTTGTCDPKTTGVCSVDGKCTQGDPRCVDPGCSTVMDCGTPPPMCNDCGDGTCAAFQCIDKKCMLTCPDGDPNLQCKTSEDCPVLDNCIECDGGKCAVQACLQNYCQLVCPVKPGG